MSRQPTADDARKLVKSLKLAGWRCLLVLLGFLVFFVVTPKTGHGPH